MGLPAPVRPGWSLPGVADYAGPASESWADSRLGLRQIPEAKPLLLSSKHIGMGILPPSSVEPGSSPALAGDPGPAPLLPALFPRPFDPRPAVSEGSATRAAVWPPGGGIQESARPMQAGSGLGRKASSPSSILEEFLNYLLAGDQRRERAQAGPAGWGPRSLSPGSEA